MRATLLVQEFICAPVAPESESLLDDSALLNIDEELFTGMRLAGE